MHEPTYDPQRRVFYIDVGDKDPKEVLAYLEKVREEYMRKRTKGDEIDAARERVGITHKDIELAIEVCHDLMNRVMRIEADELHNPGETKIYRDQEAAVRKLLRLAGYD
jgi:hypothetical protein